MTRLALILPLIAAAILIQIVTCAALSPQIQAISPTSGAAGSRLVILGRGFDPQNTVYFGNTAVHHVPIASAAGIACSANPNCRAGIMQTLELAVPSRLAPGAYKIVVKNLNGSSNSSQFEVR